MPADGSDDGALELKIEPSGEVRDPRWGKKLGQLADMDQSDKELSCYLADLVDAAHGKFRARGRDLKDPRKTRLLRDCRTGGLEPEFAHLLAGNSGDLGVKDVTVPGTLATFLMAPVEAAADLVCPVTLIKKPYGAWLADNVSTDIPADTVDQSTSAGGSVAEINPQLTATQFDATSAQALQVQYPAELFGNTDIDLQKLAIRRLCNVFKVRREKRVASILTTATNFNASNRIAAAAKWNQAFAATTATPIIDVFAAMQPSLITPTHIIITEAIAHYFFANPQVYQFLTAIGESSSRAFPSVIVATMRYTTAAVINYVWGASNSANTPLVYAPDDQPEVMATARTLRYIGDAPDIAASTEANGFMLRKFVDARGGPMGSFRYVLVANDIDLMLNTQLGAIITGTGA